MPEWTIESELAESQGVESAAEALQSMGLIETIEQPFEILELSAWRQRGSETYIYEFEVKTPGGSTQLIAKACVVPPGSGPLQSVVDEWLERRRILSAGGVEVPKLYVVHRATLVEEFIPHGFTEALDLLVDRTPLLRSFGNMTGVLTRLGFPVLTVADVRSRGDDAVWIDFGSDLGPPGQVPEYSASILDDALGYLETHGVRLSPADVRLISSEFEAALRQ